ncbi:BTAD domain-containing putative transcriptional regulator [Nonomuraea sp. NPDC050404]|uniref:AfsR/SARP family transcriptional regulator n=1 Tax=Nonomuraea sp. NPDC050404 TaxID=3155783 RepID=UPI0033C9E223
MEAVHDGAVITLGAPRHRRLLAALLLNAGRVVSVAKLTDALWGDAPPRTAGAMLHVRVSELRNVLRAAGARLLTRDGGYVLRVGPDGLDAERFERLAASGAAALAGGDPGRARAELDAALALWRGPALGEFAEEPFARPDATRLAELRLRAVENHIAADLGLGRHDEVVAELRKLVAGHPLRERFWGQLMLALYRGGRQAEALQAYQGARRHLSDQLGLDPGDALQTLHHAILTADPALLTANRALPTTNPAPPAADPALPAADPALPAADPVPLTADPALNASVRISEPRSSSVPAQLPADVPTFTGRSAELTALDEMLVHDRSAPVVLSGTAGVGKTALAIAWAHRVRGRFPDGQLYVNLRGYDPDPPMAAADALARFLAALGVPASAVPLDPDERAARYRTEVAGRRLLILLDNTLSVEQVRPLLPGGGPSRVLITSRDSLAGLVARDGARRLELGLLSPADALTLLRRLLGPRADTGPGDLTALADRCARLPLALRVAAELAAAHPATPLPAPSIAEVVTSTPKVVGGARSWLELLDAGGDPRTAVTAVFSWSLRSLRPRVVRTFGLLGLHPGADLDAYATAALADTGLATARRDLETLARAHLLHPTSPRRYAMHALLRAYATSLTPAQDARRDGGAALGRLSDYYVAASTTAMRTLHPAVPHRAPGVPRPVRLVPNLADSESARRWLDTEQRNLVAVAVQAARHGRRAHATHLSAILHRLLSDRWR